MYVFLYINLYIYYTYICMYVCMSTWMYLSTPVTIKSLEKFVSPRGVLIKFFITYNVLSLL